MKDPIIYHKINVEDIKEIGKSLKKLVSFYKKEIPLCKEEYLDRLKILQTISDYISEDQFYILIKDTSLIDYNNNQCYENEYDDGQELSYIRDNI